MIPLAIHSHLIPIDMYPAETGIFDHSKIDLQGIWEDQQQEHYHGGNWTRRDISREGAGSKFLLIKRATTSKPTLSLRNEI